MSSVPDPYLADVVDDPTILDDSAATHGPHSPRFYKLVVFAQIFALCAIVGLAAFTYGQSRTQHQICQLIGYFGDQTQHGIDTNSKLIKQDMRIDTPAAKADAAIRRHALSQSTTVLIHLNAIHC